MQQSINVGLIGFGMAGQVFHAPIINCVPGLRLHTIYARRAEQQAIIHSKYPQTQIVADPQDIIQDPDIELVIVATANSVHFSLTKDALLAGKHVVVEKPFTNTATDAEELIALAQKQGKILSVFHSARWHSDYLTVQDVLKSGELGRLVTYEVRYDRFRNYLRPGAWREEDLPGSGIFFDLGAHLIDQSLQLFGKPQAIFTYLRKMREGVKAVDDFEIMLYYHNLKVSLKGSMLIKEPTPRFALYGTDGAFVKHGVDPQEVALKEGRTPLNTSNWGEEPSDIWGILHTDTKGSGFDARGPIPSKKGNYPGFYENVRDAIHGTAELVVKPEQAKDVIEILELGLKSHAERRVIDLS
ncbi:oxidoreductase [Olivibacter sp. SDN3]|uniref:oxidoreductase n=1 Tax=Olivibacter sp. SDN3 TaxID=2764720 RepID=UPI00165123FA|nr:oxidoreductase [Olivibacter sp. SDN3]QNL48600.1 oxidoreductase [Olivibacter sp. SDN3]